MSSKCSALVVLLASFAMANASFASPSGKERVAKSPPTTTMSTVTPPAPGGDQQSQENLRKYRENLQKGMYPAEGDADGAEDEMRSALREGVEAPPSPLRKELKKAARNAYRAKNERVLPANLEVRDLVWSIGDPIPTIQMAEGYQTLIQFFDASGRPWPLVAPGLTPGDPSAIHVIPGGLTNTAMLQIKRPWASTNASAILSELQTPIPIALQNSGFVDSDQPPSVDMIVRIRVVTGVGKSYNPQDRYNNVALEKMVNHLGQGEMQKLIIQTVQKGVAESGDNWRSVSERPIQFYLGQDGMTYVIASPGYRMTYPAQSVLSYLSGPDGTLGYIVGGKQTRLFNFVGPDGAIYKMQLGR